MQCYIVKCVLLSSDKIGDLLSGRCYLTRKSLGDCQQRADFRFDARAFKRKYRLNVSILLCCLQFSRNTDRAIFSLVHSVQVMMPTCSLKLGKDALEL